MPMPQFKVNVTHSGTSTDYTPSPFTQVQVKRRENNYDTATLWFADKYWQYYEDSIDHFDEVKIYFRDASATSTYTQVFGGWVHQVAPTLNSQGYLPQVICKGYGCELEVMNCNDDYGEESSNDSYQQPDEILGEMIGSHVEKNFGGDASGWSLNITKISDYINTDIKYINNPYRSTMDLANTVCMLGSAIGAGSTAGPHWIVDHSKQFCFAKIGDHTAGANSPEASWPTWWNTDAAGSTLTEGLDFTEMNIVDKMEEFANNVVLITDFRRPAYDFWTEDATDGGSALWTNVNLTTLANSATSADAAKGYVVGSHNLKLADDTGGYAYLDFGAATPLDITKWGSAKTIPHLNFYMCKKSLNNALCFVSLEKVLVTDYWSCLFNTWTEADSTWVHKSIPIGPYWESSEESKFFRWTANGAIGTDWTSIRYLCFTIVCTGADGQLNIDDLHFNGKIIRQARNEYSIAGNVGPPAVTAKKEHQKVLISRNAMDDSCIASIDTGFAARVAYAELLRRQTRPQTIVFSTPRNMSAAMAGQQIHVHACKKRDGSFRVDKDFRILEINEDLNQHGWQFTVTATSDVLNSFPISSLNRFEMWQENMFLNSKEAKNIRSGAEVDLLIPILEKVYNSDDD